MFVSSLCVLLSAFQVTLGVDFTYYVQEGQNPGTYVGDIAVDTRLLDTISHQDRKLIRFSQIKHGVPSAAQLFRVARSTGKLYTAQSLDAEDICIRNEECFKMVDVAVRKGESFVKILEIKVVVKDVNDHQPLFPDKQVFIQFSEDDRKGAKRSIPNAVDQDAGVSNSQITYELKKNKEEPFTLSVAKNLDGTSKLSITLEDMLDREVKDSYVIQVVAKDGGTPPRQSTLDVHISVTDVNDNPPIFSQNVYNVSIKYEHDKALPITILSATDSDLNQNRRISFHFSSQTSSIARTFFELNVETGEVFLRKKITFAQKLAYKLYVQATDGGRPPLSSTAMVIVNVINQQNTPPSIDVSFVSESTGNTASISEDIEVGSFIAYVKVTDNDVGQNGEVSCYLQHQKFQLQSLGTKKYKVIIKNPLDREVQDHHDITISCQDKGMPPLHSESKFSIKVLDVNDVRPQFTERTLKFSIYENQRSKFPVGYINATDPDLGLSGQLSYSLLDDKKHFLPFQISNNGLISTLVSLDHEFQSVYNFKVMVRDNGSPSFNNTVNVIVEVRDRNDNAPHFIFPSINPFTLEVIYYAHHTKNITVLKATDKDSRENSFLKYEITSGNEKKMFFLNRYSGLLTFARELTKQDAGSYYLSLIVKDNGIPVLSATTNLTMVLTVSNRTYEMLNGVNGQGDEKVHMFLMIAIVLVSMTVSVPITAAMAICFVRCRNNKDADTNSCKKHISEQKHLMCTSHLDSSWAEVPGDRTTEFDTTIRSSGHQKSRRGIYPGDQLDKSRKSTASGGSRTLKDKEVIYQEIGGEEREQQLRQSMIAKNCHINLMSSDTDDGWSDGDTGKNRQLTAKGLAALCNNSSSRAGKHKRPIHKRFFCRRDTNTVNRCLKAPNIGHIPDCTQWIDLRTTKPEMIQSDFDMHRQQQQQIIQTKRIQ